MHWLFHNHLRSQLPGGWGTTAYDDMQHTKLGPCDNRSTIRYHHKETGLVAFGGPLVINSIRCSLPKILFGTNSRLMKSQAEINEALRLVSLLLTQIADPYEGIQRFTRVDLVWQFRMDPRLAILAHRHARHPRIRSTAFHYEGESIHWKGSALHVRMYDKALEQTRKRGDVLRLEMELHNPLLQNLFADGTGRLAHLDFSRAYAIYRELVLGFSPCSIPQKLDWAEFLMMAEAIGASYNGVSFFELWAQGRNREHVRRVQKKMASLRPDYFGIDWATILPIDGPPPAVEIP